jgi:hypothetical protein
MQASKTLQKSSGMESRTRLTLVATVLARKTAVQPSSLFALRTPNITEPEIHAPLENRSNLPSEKWPAKSLRLLA